jgi:hypothetical protein
MQEVPSGMDIAPGRYLLDLACAAGGIYTPVGDGSGAQHEAKLVDALMTFSRYFQVTNSVFKRTTGGWGRERGWWWCERGMPGGCSSNCNSWLLVDMCSSDCRPGAR